MSKGNRLLLIFGVVILAGAITIVTVGYNIYQSGFWQGPDVKFGDQHLKTSVSLIELHKIRYGKYPKSLGDLKFIGDWDPIAIQSVRYRVNDEQSKYCVDVVRGWVGKPQLQMPDEFWQGTGYDASVCNIDQ